MFVDEVGNSTNMKDDGNVSGEKLLNKKGFKARVTAATNDAHFMVLGFASGTGASVMCEMIFSAHNLTPEQQLGYDIRADIVENDFSMRANHKPGKQYPGGPICRFNGVDVPVFICCSPRGGIISKLLAQMLQRMDQLNFFTRNQTGPVPFLLLYGHARRLQLKFLRYINNPEHIWRVCIGVTNATAHWQVGDSPGENGSWKMGTTEDKRVLVLFKTRMGMCITITKIDIVPIICRSLDKSFASEVTGKREIAMCG